MDDRMNDVIDEVQKADVLSDNLYYYNAVNDAVSIVE